MTKPRVKMLSFEAAREAAEAQGVHEAVAKLHVFRTMFHRPTTAKAISDLLFSLLFHAALDNRLREFVIMRIGWVTGCDYEWTQHWKIAQAQFGCSEKDLLELREWRTSDHFGDDEKAILEVTDQLLETGDVVKSVVDDCLERFGQNATIELMTAVGTWRLVSKFTKALEIPLEDGIESWPPDGTPPA